MRKLTSMRIEEEILNEARKLGLNVSKTCENLLKLYINALKTANKQILSDLRINEERTEKKNSGDDLNPLNMSPRGFEPLLSGSEGQNSSLVVDWEDFEDWLLKDHKLRVAKDMVSYAKRYHYLLKRDFGEIKKFTDGKRRHILKSLSALSKYLGIYEDFRKLIRNYGISWNGKSSADLMIDRLTKVCNSDEVFNWIKKVKQEIPDLRTFMDFLAISGLRLCEAIDSYNLIIKLARQNKLSEYYNEKNETLEHFKFKEAFIRKTKKTFVSFIPKEFIIRITNNSCLKSYHSVKKTVQNKLKIQRFGDIREIHATYLTKYLKQPEIDFLHGRIGTNVFMQNYFNPALINDLKERTFKAIKEITYKIS